jgi:2-oxoglutarate dehydrogenase E2 component (dihydrolipoamide succinyltransferase)
MEVEIRVPAIGESIKEVTLSTWFKQDGDYINVDDPLCEFESDKATLELPSEAAGTLKRVAKEGDDLEIGALVAIIDTSAKKEDAPAKAKEVKEVKTEEKKAEKPIAKTEPAPEAKPAPKVEEKPTPKVEEKPAPVQTTSSNPEVSGFPSPSAKKILDEKNIDPKSVEGTGRDGRITKEDAIKASEAKPVSAENPAIVPASGNFSRGESKEKMSRLRRTISKRLVAAKNETAMLTTFNEVDMTALNKVRDQYKDIFREKYDINLGFMSFFTRACALALLKFPAINAYIEDEEIIYHEFADISIAVSTPKGLVVPVVRNAESLSFAEIEKEIKRLAIAGRDGNLTLEEMTGGTFTISNGGVFGSLLSTPILNQPQSAILGMHKIQDRPVAIDGKVEIRPMMYLALSYDHRIVDGKESVSFLVLVKDYLENPEKMLLGEDPIKAMLKL